MHDRLRSGRTSLDHSPERRSICALCYTAKKNMTAGFRTGDLGINTVENPLTPNPSPRKNGARGFWNLPFWAWPLIRSGQAGLDQFDHASEVDGFKQFQVFFPGEWIQAGFPTSLFLGLPGVR